MRGQRGLLLRRVPADVRTVGNRGSRDARERPPPSLAGSGGLGAEIRDQDHRDVVGAARVDRELHHVGGGTERVGQRLGQREPGQGGSLGQVVPQAVGADEQGPRPGRREPLDVRGALRVIGQVRSLTA